MSSVVMVGGGVQEVRAVEQVQAQGYNVIVTDRRPDAPCFTQADQAWVVDGKDDQAIAQRIIEEREQHAIEGVFTLTELVETVARVADAAELPGVPVDAATRCQDKAAAQACWQAAGLPVPRGGVARTFEEARTLLQELASPIFLKPTIGFGGQHGTCINTEDELRVAMESGAQVAAWIVEEYIEGASHDVNGLFDEKGDFHGLGITDRFFLDAHPVEAGIRAPTVLAEDEQIALYKLLEQCARALRISFGPVKGDALRDGESFKMIEIAPRLHGPRNSVYALPLAGIDPLTAMLPVITGHDWQAWEPRAERCCLSRLIEGEPGRVTCITGCDAAGQIEGVAEVMLFCKEGDTLSPLRNSTHAAGYLFAVGEDEAACRKAMEKARSTLQIETEPV